MEYKFKTQPYKHQLDALEKSWNKDTFAYFMEKPRPVLWMKYEQRVR